MEAGGVARAGTSTSSAIAANPTCNLRMHCLLRELRTCRTATTPFTLRCRRSLDDPARPGSTIFSSAETGRSKDDSTKWMIFRLKELREGQEPDFPARLGLRRA